MKAKKDVKKVLNQYSAEFKKQVLDRAEKDGIAATARDLNLKKSSSTLGGRSGGWRG